MLNDPIGDKVVIIGAGVAVGALDLERNQHERTGHAYAGIQPARQESNLQAPACMLLFIGIWIEKGISLIVPGLVPAPMGEVVDYAILWVKIGVTQRALAWV